MRVKAEQPTIELMSTRQKTYEITLGHYARDVIIREKNSPLIAMSRSRGISMCQKYETIYF